MFRPLARAQRLTPLSSIMTTQLPRPHLPSSQSPFSTHIPHRNKQNTDPEMPAFTLQGLGISRNMKVALVTLVCVFGTMETYTYYRWFKGWYYGETKEDGTATEK
ncbi:hypothetical protein ACO1O0_006836 [Amphichorda felina]